ncbi:MAG: 4-carboxy-4-hydroxy-2-oxoadipate aldolase/oxaloacetate decarboxylase [Thermoplasmatales archaeon]|nr:4-carboxy-4-hydroxy-2-oxoadipate aldolase/oxaloacetate decarboxylase [Thermoplasmatales archaeon]
MPRSGDDLEICRLLASFGVATVAESQEKQNVMDSEIRPIQTGKSIAGTAITVRSSDADNLMIHAAIEYCQKGDLLVVSTLSETRNGYFGELMATACKRKEVAGLIIDGGVRDTKRLREIDFPVWSRYVNVTGTSKSKPGWVNIPISAGNVTVNPGDFVVADDDGVVVVRRENIREILNAAKAREEKENATRQKIAKGELSMDFYSLRKVVQDLHIEIIEREDVRID